MSTKQERAVYLYLTPPEVYFWNWNSDSSAASWSNGAQAASVEELLSIFVRMELQIIPPLGSLLLILDACDNNWSKEQTSQLLERLLPTITKGEYQHKESIHRLVNLLETLHDFTKGYRQSTAKFVSFIELIFRKSLFNQDTLVPQGIIDGLKSKVWKNELPIFNDAVGRFNDEMSLLESALKSINADSLSEQLQTGVSDITATDSVPEVEGELLSLTSVLDDPELFQLGRLTQQLVSLVEIPRKLEDSGDVSSGGVSDITTKGDLDKLLLSELAHDDLNLSIRLANNEALFIRREVPPVLPENSRIILLDNGLRFWGVSRLFATAVALAFSFRQEENQECFHLNHGRYTPIEFRHKDSLLKHLGLLETGLQSGNALDEVLSDKMNQNPEVVLVTHKKVFDDQEFRRHFRKLNIAKIFICLIDQFGSFRMIEKNDKGMKVLSNALINLAEIIDSKESKSLKKNMTGFPLVLSEQKFPLLLPGWNIIWSFTSESDETVALTKDNRVLVKKGRHQFEYREIYNKLPFGHYKRCFIDTNGRIYVVVVDNKWTLHLYRFNQELEFIDEQTMVVENNLVGLEISRQLIQIKTHQGIDFYSLETLTKLSTSPTPEPIINKYGTPYTPHQKIWKFQNVFIDKDWFYLRKKDVIWTFKVQNQTLKLVQEYQVSINNQKIYQFSDHGMYDGTRIKLSSAKTGNNSRFVLDSRGILHLMSSNPDIPEISILLSSGANTAAYTQSKHFAGAKRFLGDRSESFDEVIDTIKEFCRNAI